MKRILTILFVIGMIFNICAKGTPQYTSLVIDASDIKLERSSSPKILNESGLEIYGTVLNEKDLNIVMNIGVFAYIDTLNNAKKNQTLKNRLGNKPLVIKAKGVVGKTNSNVVIKNSDAVKVLKSNKISGFLDKFNVIVLLGKK